MASMRSDCSVLVGNPVLGPPRCESTMTAGISAMESNPRASDINDTPGPGAAATRGDFIFGLARLAAYLGRVARQPLHYFRGRCDWIAEETFYSRRRRAQRDRLVAGHEQVAFRFPPRQAEALPLGEIVAGEANAFFQRLHVVIQDRLALFGELLGEKFFDSWFGNSQELG